MCEWLTPQQQRICNQGEPCCVYKAPSGPISADKKEHAERSIANQPNHLKHKWKSITVINGIK
jgi:hypothetical protein